MLLTTFAWQTVLECDRYLIRSSDELGSPKTRQLYDWWTRHATDGIPLRNRFDITEHRELVSQISFIDVPGDGTFRTNILGARIQWWVDEDRSDRALTPASERTNDRFLHALYSSVAESGRPWLNRGTLQLVSGEVRKFEGVDCPLSRDGITVSAIVGVLDFL